MERRSHEYEDDAILAIRSGEVEPDLQFARVYAILAVAAATVELREAIERNGSAES